MIDLDVDIGLLARIVGALVTIRADKTERDEIVRKVLIIYIDEIDGV